MDKELVEFLGQKFERIENQIEEVRGEMKQGFNAVNQRVDGLDSRIDEVETRMTQGFTDVNQRIDTVAHTVEILNQRDLQDSNAFAKDIAQLTKTSTALDTRVSRLEATAQSATE